MPSRAIHGDTLGGRVSANAGGRRDPFPEGLTPLPIQEMLPLRERAERGRACATPKAGVRVQRQGAVDRVSLGSQGQVQRLGEADFGAVIGPRHRRPCRPSPMIPEIICRPPACGRL